MTRANFYRMAIMAALALGSRPASAGAQLWQPLGAHLHSASMVSRPSSGAGIRALDTPSSKGEHVAWGVAFGAIAGGVVGALVGQGDHSGEGLGSTVMAGAGALAGACIGAVVGLLVPTS